MHKVTQMNESDECGQLTRKDSSFEYRAKRCESFGSINSWREFKIFYAAEQKARRPVTVETESSVSRLLLE